MCLCGIGAVRTKEREEHPTIIQTIEVHQRHILHYVIALAGLWPLWRGRAEFKGSGADLRLLGAVLLGFSLWWFVDIVLFHWVLAIHRIRVGVANPLAYDLGWLAVFGATTLLAGLWLRSRSTTDGVRSWLHVSALPERFSP